jgi:hypothetical protein
MDQRRKARQIEQRTVPRRKLIGVTRTEPDHAFSYQCGLVPSPPLDPAAIGSVPLAAAVLAAGAAAFAAGAIAFASGAAVFAAAPFVSAAMGAAVFAVSGAAGLLHADTIKAALKTAPAIINLRISIPHKFAEL